MARNGKIEALSIQNTPPHEAHLLKLCVDKAFQGLDWKPTLNSEVAINWTVDWYKMWHDNNADLRKISIYQINKFKEVVVNK